MDGKQSLLKTDVRGRVRTPVERREALLDEFERSGLGGPKFAALVGVPLTDQLIKVRTTIRHYVNKSQR